jgi:hypothetical protein
MVLVVDSENTPILVEILLEKMEEEETVPFCKNDILKAPVDDGDMNYGL